MPEIIYISNYPCLEEDHYRFANRAAALQSNYLAQTLTELGYDVTILSTSTRNERKKVIDIDHGFTRHLAEGGKVVYLPSVDSRYSLFRVLGRFLFNRRLRSYIRKNNGIYIVYHSTLHYNCYRWIRKFGYKFILEVEEIYADVTQNKSARLLEIKETGTADAYIIPNSMMCPEVTRNKKWVLYHGSCRQEPKMGNIFQDGKIHIVYAGTMDPRKVGLMPSLDAAMFLSNRYVIHVLAVSYPENQRRIKERVSAMAKPHCEIVFHEPLDGDDYLRFIQSCDLGFYTQGADAIDINTSFPSKLMSYLSNGLRIVAPKTKPLLMSELSDVIYFAETNSGEDMAKAVREIDFNDGYDGREKAAEIHERLKKNLRELIEHL